MLLTYPIVQACLRQRIPISDFLCYDVSAILDEDTQQKFYKDLFQISATNPFYVKSFLSRYIRILESRGEVAEELYELVCDATILGSQELSPTTTDILHYTVGKDATVSIKETPKVISGQGTTGLRTWEAALYLLNMLNRPGVLPSTQNLKDQRIVELGTGTGLVSLALLKCREMHQFSEIVLTDGDSILIEKLQSAFDLNGIHDPSVKTQQLLWGTTNPLSPDFIQEVPTADVVVAADVTYDKLIVPQLCDTLADFFAGGTRVALVAATARNLETLGVWETEISNRFSWCVEGVAEDPHLLSLGCWFKRGTPEIRIYKLTLK